MLVQFAFFMAYFLVSIPAAAIVQAVGYMRTAVVGLLVMTLGCVLFIPASLSAEFTTFLLALFVLASGITIVQVVANPLISKLGPPQTASSRLTFAQAFNSLGTTIAPYVGAMLILGGLAKIDEKTLSGAALMAYRVKESHVIVQAYIGIAVALVLVALAVWTQRKALVEAKEKGVNLLKSFDLLSRPRFAFGTLGIFLYVGGEVAIGSLLVNYLMQAQVLGLATEEAGKMVGFYWGGAMVGRFIGAWVLRQFHPATVLMAAAAVVLALLGISANTSGQIAGYSLILVGLFNAIMFPTIFSLASEGLGTRAAEGSGLLCVAIVGGAIVPLLTGLGADQFGLQLALGVPALCYLGIAAFGRYCRKNPVLDPGQEARVASSDPELAKEGLN